MTRKDKIVNSARSLFSRQGFSATGLRHIAEKAGVSLGNIYNHFRNKDELFEAVLGYSQEPLLALVERARREPDPRAAVDGFVDEWFRLLVEDDWYRQSFEILLNKTELTDAMVRTIRRERELTRAIVATLGARIHELAPAGDADAESLGLLCYTFLMGITQSWLFAPQLFSLAERRAFFTARLERMLGLA